MERQLRADGIVAMSKVNSDASQEDSDMWSASVPRGIRAELVEEDSDCFTELYDLGQRMCKLECVMQRTTQTQCLILERLGIDVSGERGDAKLQAIELETPRENGSSLEKHAVLPPAEKPCLPPSTWSLTGHDRSVPH